MKSALIFVALGLSATTVLGQGLPDIDIPECATTCLIGGLAQTGCELTDFKCACSNEAFVQGSAACVQKSCDEEDRAKALQVAYELCKSAGVEIPTTFPGASETASAPPSVTSSIEISSTPAPPEGTSTVAPPEGTSTVVPSISFSSTLVPTGTGGAPNPTTNGTIIPPSTRPTAPPADGAASRFGASLGAVGLAIAGLLMM